MAFNDYEQQELILLSQAIDNYYRNPQEFNVDDVGFLKQEADRLGIKVDHVPDPTEASQTKTKIGGAPGAMARFLGQPFIGYLEGMTTFRTDALQPESSVEGILRSVGHLAGFVAPWGVPRKVTDAVAKRAKKLIPSQFKKEFAKRVRPHKYAMVGFNLAESALHLGTMSAVSNWQEGVDGMVKAFFGGAEIGAGFHALQWIGSAKNPNPGLALARMLAGSIYSGLPSTMRGETAPDQVYNYLLGAWFTRKHRNLEFDKTFLGSKEMMDFSKASMDLDKTIGKIQIQNVIRTFQKAQKTIDKDINARIPEQEVEPKPVKDARELQADQREEQLDYFTEARTSLHNQKGMPLYKMAEDFGITKKSLTRALERVASEDYATFRKQLTGVLAHSKENGVRKGMPYEEADFRRIHNELINVTPVGKSTMTMEDRTGEKYDTFAIIDTPVRRDGKKVKKHDYMNALNDNFFTVENTASGRKDLYETISEMGRINKFEVDIGKAAQEFSRKMREKGWAIVGSPSDNDKVIMVRDKYRGWTKDQLVEQNLNRWGLTADKLKEMKKQELSDMATTHDVIDQVWGQAGSDYFSKSIELNGVNEALSDFTKRLQIPAARGISPPKDKIIEFNKFLSKKLPKDSKLKIDQNENIRTLVVDDAFFEQVGINKADWIKAFGKDAEGKPLESLIGDGAEYLHPELMKALNEGMGEDISSNFGKWFTHAKGTKADGDYVASIKSGTFKASSELTRLMERLGVGRIVLSSAVKIKSDNIVNTQLKFNPKQKQWYPVVNGKKDWTAVENNVFDTKPIEMKFKFSAHEESAGGAGGVGMLQQMLNFMEHNHPASQALWGKVINDQLSSVNETIRILTAPGGEKKLESYVRKLMNKDDREVLLNDIEQPITDKPTLGERGKWMEKYDAGYQSAFNLLSQSMRPQTLQILTNDLVRKRLLRPMNSGGFFVIEPMLPDNYTKTFSGKPLTEGGVILPKSIRQAVIFTPDGKKTLGEIIDAQRAKGNTSINLQMLGARSPVSAVNAIKNLNIEGIREDEGYTAIVHPRVVKEIKGDFDADKLHVYWNLPKEVTDYFKEKAKSQETSKYIYELEGYKELKDKLFKADSFFSPEQRMMKAMNFVLGKKGIGEFANNIQRYDKALTQKMDEKVDVVGVRWRNDDGTLNMKKSGYKVYRKAKAEELAAEKKVKIIRRMKMGVRVAKQDPKSVREFLDAWLNTAVDSGKLGGLPEEDVYRSLMLEKMFEVYDMPTGMNPAKAIFAVRDTKFWKEFGDFRSVISKEYDEVGIGRELDFNQIVDKASLLTRPGLNVEHLMAQMDKSKKVTLENFIKGLPDFKKNYREFVDKFGLGRDFEKQIRKTRKIGDKIVDVERSSEYDRNLTRDVMRAALMQEILPEVDGKYRFVQIRRALDSKEKTFDKQEVEYLKKVFKDIDPRTIKEVRAISKIVREELPQGVDMSGQGAYRAIEKIKTRITNYSKLLGEKQKKQYLYLLDIPNLKIFHHGIGLEIKDVHGIPGIERGKAEIMNEFYSKLVGQPKVGKEKSVQPLSERVREIVNEKPNRTSSKGDVNTAEDKVPYVEWRNKSKTVDQFAELLKEFPDFATEANINSLIKFLSLDPSKNISNLTYRELWGINRYLKDLKSQGLIGLLQKKNKLAIGWLDGFMMPERSGFKLRLTDREWIKDPDLQLKVPMSAMDQLGFAARKMHYKMNTETQIYEKLVSDRIETILGELKSTEGKLDKLSKKEVLDIFRLGVMKLEGNDKTKGSIYKKKWGEVSKEYNALPKQHKDAVNLLEKEIGTFLTQFHKTWIKKLDKQRQDIAEEFGLRIPAETGFKDFYFPHTWHSKDFENAFNERRALDKENFLKKPRTEEDVERFEKQWDKLYEELVVRRTTDQEGHGIVPMHDNEIPELGIKLGRDFSNMRGRHLDIQGYRYEPAALTDYVRRAIRTYNMNELGMEGRRIIDSFSKRMGGTMSEKDVAEWSEFMRIYVRDNIAQPSKPSEIIKKSVYNYLSDKNVMTKWNSIVAKLGMPGLEMKNEMDLVNINNLDAKFNLASLLFSTKTFIANLTGGSANTIIYSGLKPSINAFSMYFGNDKDLLAKYVPKEFRFKEGIDPMTGELKPFPLSNREVIDRLLKVNGVIEEFLEYEAYLGKSGKGKRLWHSMSQELDQIHAKTGKITREDVSKTARKYGIGEEIATKAGFFMRISEKPLRAMSFLTGYMNAKDKGLPEEIAVALGKKHIQATQYLYNNAFRPQFARTNLGKVLTRFQFWSWSSIKFRRELAQKASYVGFKPGSEQYESLKRMMTFDLFMLGMANMFMFSLFESALPPPYNYAQDTAQLLFGDEEDKKNAFFGTYGLNLVMPAPSARIPVQLFKSILNNDWDRFVNYHVWTWFPFGRFSRDVYKFGKMPAYGVETWTGLPIHKLSGYKKKRESYDEKYGKAPRPKGLVSGIF